MPFDPPAQLTRARVLTRILREERWWASLRDELRCRGLDAADVILLESFDDADGIDVGLLATRDERLIAWSREFDDAGNSRIIDWRDITAAWSGTSWAGTAGEYVQAVRNTRFA